MKPESELIQGIQEQTQAEIDRIHEEMTRLETEKTGRTDADIEAIRSKIDEYTESQLRKAKKAAQAMVSTECHKIELEARERLFAQIVESSAARIKGMIGEKGYSEVLKGWIVEAAVGLASDEAVVSASSEEMEACRLVLPDAAEEVAALVGHPVTLRLSKTISPGQGVILTAGSGRTAYNNQVRTRMMRRETEIRRVIYEELSHAIGSGDADGEQPRESSKHDG
ncbi:MAG TPA: V-type ATP synthase subunit E [Spirochaetia bacterium]|nr:V-type ATP synthase subunit E [Spirochaetia bacterium]